VAVETQPGAGAGELLARAAAEQQPVVWLGSPDGDPGLLDALAAATAARVAAGWPAPGVELVVGSHDVPGARLLDLVAVMDRLRSPGGCPWDAAQTHRSLASHLLEEAHEVLEALEALDPPGGDATQPRDPAHLQEELGDLLMQIVFHARLGEEDPVEPWSVDDVADGIVAKLVRRHPHVFGGPAAPEPGSVATPAHVESAWDRLKAAEKGRASAADGIPAGLPALAVTATLAGRVARAGLEVALPGRDAADAGDRLLALAAEVAAAGGDPEQALREANRRLASAVRAAEAGTVPGGMVQAESVQGAAEDGDDPQEQEEPG
jgi:XTP/dITP diphosphohydrolase